jgi:uncharacterized membrane protein YqhA
MVLEMSQPEEKQETCSTGISQNKFIKSITFLVENSRYFVILAVLTVLIVSITLFVMGTLHSILTIEHIWVQFSHDKIVSIGFFIELLEIINTMLKGVIFYIIGVGLYNLFVTPIELCAQFKVSTLNDLEEKVVSVIIVIFALQFLKQMTLWDAPLEILYFGLATTAVTLSLVAFLRFVLQAHEK